MKGRVSSFEFRVFNLQSAILCVFVVIFIFAGCSKQEKGNQENSNLNNNEKITNCRDKDCSHWHQ